MIQGALALAAVAAVLAPGQHVSAGRGEIFTTAHVYRHHHELWPRWNRDGDQIVWRTGRGLVVDDGITITNRSRVTVRVTAEVEPL